MASSDIYFLVGGVLVGVILGWVFWRVGAPSRDEAAHRLTRAETAERRLEKATADLETSEEARRAVELELADERQILQGVLSLESARLGGGASDLSAAGADPATGTYEEFDYGDLESAPGEAELLASRLEQSQRWLEEAQERIEVLETGPSEESMRADQAEVALDQTHRALVEADSQVQSLTARLESAERALRLTGSSVEEINRHARAARESVAVGLDDDLVIDLTDGADGAQMVTDGVGHDDSIPQRAAELVEEIDELKARVSEEEARGRQLGDHIEMRDEIDQRLDAIFVEVHELRGRSAAIRSEIRGSLDEVLDQ